MIFKNRTIQFSDCIGLVYGAQTCVFHGKRNEQFIAYEKDRQIYQDSQQKKRMARRSVDAKTIA